MLSDLLTYDVFQFLLVFARLGAVIMMLPGFGSPMVSTRIRLILALGLCLVVTPVVGSGLPAMPQQPAALLLLLFGEITIGLFLGLTVQALMVALNLAGSYMSYQSGMANALVRDPVSEQQSLIIPSFMANLAVVMIFVTDLHHLMLRAAVDSYLLFRPGAPLPLGDFANAFARTLGDSFALGLQLAGPVLVFGVIFNTGLGLISRLMPALQVYFVAIPIQVLVGILLLSATLPAMMMWFLRAMEDGLLPFTAGG